MVSLACIAVFGNFQYAGKRKRGMRLNGIGFAHPLLVINHLLCNGRLQINFRGILRLR
jgi:hypothetical protein